MRITEFLDRLTTYVAGNKHIRRLWVSVGVFLIVWRLGMTSESSTEKILKNIVLLSYALFSTGIWWKLKHEWAYSDIYLKKGEWCNLNEDERYKMARGMNWGGFLMGSWLMLFDPFKELVNNVDILDKETLSAAFILIISTPYAAVLISYMKKQNIRARYLFLGVFVLALVPEPTWLLPLVTFGIYYFLTG